MDSNEHGNYLMDQMFAFIRTMSNRSKRFEYKGCRVELFAGKRGMQWTWAFVVNGTETKANETECCKTAALAMEAARAAACSFIDRER
jgi:hypothetical protein